MKNSLLQNLLTLAAAGCGLIALQLHAADSGWFMKGEVGPSFVNGQSITTSGPFGGSTARLSFKTGVRLDLDGGYQFNDSWGIDMELGYIYNSVDVANSTGATSTSPDLYQIPFIVNATYTLPFAWTVKPYVGAGAGVEVTGLNGFGDICGVGQLLAGVKYDLNRRVDLGVGYKLLVTTTHQWNDLIFASDGGRTIEQSIVAAVTLKF